MRFEMRIKFKLIVEALNINHKFTLSDDFFSHSAHCYKIIMFSHHTHCQRNGV